MKKKFIAGFGIFAMVLSCACGSKEDVKESSIVVAETSTKSADTSSVEESAVTEESVLEESAVRDESDEAIIQAFSGEWWDMTSQRARMNIQYTDHEYQIQIRWTNEDGNDDVWDLTGYYDATMVAVSYKGSFLEETHDEDGNVVSDIKYKDASGIIYMVDDVIYWSDFNENHGEGSVFYKAD